MNCTDTFGSEHLKAAGMEPREEYDRVPRFQTHDGRTREMVADIRLAGGQAFADPTGARLLDVLNVGESFAAQEFLRDILGCLTDAWNLDQSNPRRLGRRLCGAWPGTQTEQACCPHQ